ncbi:hypothetical protein AB2T19_000153 [Clostridium botulinum]
MGQNKKITSKRIASIAAKTLIDKSASSIQRSLATSALAQTNDGKQTGKTMEKSASKVLKSSKYNNLTKSFAASILSQYNKKDKNRFLS